MMKIILTEHAKKRMIERKISLKNIEQGLQMPDYTIVRGKMKEVHKKIDDKILKVVFEENKYIKVVTVVWK